jgi:hypothetical protein
VIAEPSGTRLAQSLEQAERDRAHAWSYALVFGALVGPLLSIECYSLYHGAYDDDAVFAHDTRVNFGPMRGTITSALQARILETMDKDLKRAQAGASTITVFDGFATGYLSTRLKPRTFTHWIIWSMNPRYTKAIVKQTFGTPDKLPDLLLETNVDQGARHYWQKDFEHHYQTVVSRPDLHYRILRKIPL